MRSVLRGLACLIGPHARRCSWPLLIIHHLAPDRLGTGHGSVIAFLSDRSLLIISCFCRLLFLLRAAPAESVWAPTSSLAPCRWRVSSRLLGVARGNHCFVDFYWPTPGLLFRVQPKSRAGRDGHDVSVGWHRVVPCDLSLFSSTCHRSSSGLEYCVCGSQSIDRRATEDGSDSSGAFCFLDRIPWHWRGQPLVPNNVAFLLLLGLRLCSVLSCCFDVPPTKL